jgi:peptide/nickel transport system substrate-binding protein
MDSLYEQAQGEIDEASRLDIYRQIQELWARDLPTLDLTQKPQVALSLNNVQGVAIDALGLLHYDALTKRGG